MKDGTRVSTEGLLKVGQLAEAAGVSISTVKYYVREELVRPAVKTGKNMSWYDPACIDTVKLIRMLQQERYYPLSVIRGLLRTETEERVPEMALLDAIHKVDEGAGPVTGPGGETAGEPGAPSFGAEALEPVLHENEISALAAAGLISPAKKKREEKFSEEDLAVMRLIRKRLDAGIPLEQSIAAFHAYDRAVRGAAREDIDSFLGNILRADLRAEPAAKMIRVSDETLDQFIDIRRKEYNRRNGKAYVERLYRHESQRVRVLEKLAAVFRKHGFSEAADLCGTALRGSLPENDPGGIWFRMFLGGRRDRNADLVTKITSFQESREFFERDAAGPSGSDPDRRILSDALRYLWLSILPETLRDGKKESEAAGDLHLTLESCCPEKCGQVLRDILSCSFGNEVKENV